jgi:hypothetical protein
MFRNAVLQGLRPYHLEDLDADISTTLKQISGQGQKAGSVEHGHGPSGM